MTAAVVVVTEICAAVISVVLVSNPVPMEAVVYPLTSVVTVIVERKVPRELAKVVPARSTVTMSAFGIELVVVVVVLSECVKSPVVVAVVVA